MLDAGRRPMGRLFYWALLSAASLGWISAFGATPQNSPGTTAVQDTVYLADGTTATGTLIITWPAFVSSSGAAVAGGSTTTTVGANGALSVALVPNAGATPAGVYYTVVYQLGPGEVKTEYWVVPTTSPANLSQVRTTPGSGVAGQPVSMQYVNSALATKANDAAVVHLNGAETISGTKTFSTSPSVPAPTNSTDIATKAYVDSSVTNVGSGSYLSTAGGTMTGPITLPANPAAPMQAATKGYVDFGLISKADLIAGLVPTSELGSGTATAGSCLLGNGTWGACGGGGGSGNVSTNPAASQNVAQPEGTQFSTNNLANTRYVTASWSWQQSPADSLATAGSNTIHLTPCPLGIDTSNTASRPYYVYVAGTGAPETALVTGGTCTSGAASGTIVVNTAGSHSAGYTVGSSTSGIQEALNDSGNIGAGIVIPPTGANANALPIYATIYVQSNKSAVRGEGKPTLLCKTRSVCMFIGDRTNSNDFNGIEVSGVRFAAGNAFDGMQITNTACAANVATITVNNTGAGAVQAGDYIDINWTFLQHYIGIHLVASASATQFTYSDPNCGGYGTIASQASAGFASLENAAIEDNGNGTSLHELFMSDKAALAAWGFWQNHILVDNDQAFKLDTLNLDEGPHCTTNYCGQSIYFPGPFSTNAAVAWLSHLNLSLQCGGNGITDWAGNTLRVQNSVIQAFAQWAVFDGALRGGYGGGEFDDVYEEVGGCTNPMYPGSGAQQRAMTGLLNSAGSNTIHGGEFPIGQQPQFAATGNQAARYNYCFVVHDTSEGVSKCLPFGYALVDGTSPAGSIVVSWPRVQGTGTVTYDILRYSGAGGATVAPYPGSCGGGSTAACGSVATAIAQCGTNLCSFTDNASSATINYNVLTPNYQPGMFWLPGGIVTLTSSDATTFGTAPTFLDDNSVVTNLSPIVTENVLMPQVFSQRCSNVNGGEWLSCLAGNSNGNNSMPNATVLQYGTATGGPQANLKGRLNFTSSQNASITNGEIITLVDSNPAKTFATPGNRPTQDGADTYVGIDTPTVQYIYAGMALGAPTSISSYINSTPNGSSWLERLTTGAKTFNVPVTVNGNFSVASGTVTLPVTGSTQCLHVSAAGVVSGTGSDCGSGGGGGGSGTVNSGMATQIAMYGANGTAVSGDGALTDSGGVLSYAGSGGLAAASGSFSGNVTVGGQLILTGPWQVTTPPASSAVGAAPAGQSEIAVSNDGNFYVSANAGSPSQVLTAATDAVPSVFGRTGAVTAQNGDYSVAQVTGAAPSASPTFTGTVTEPVPVLPSQGANQFFAAPSGSAGAPGFRAIAASDVPTLNQNTTGTAASLSAASALPNGTTATTQTAGDSSTKVATTAFATVNFAAMNVSGAVGDIPKITANSPTPAISDSGVLAGPYAIPWITAMRGGTGAAFAQNTVKMWGVVLTFPVQTSYLTYNVAAADNTANNYDVGIANVSGTLVLNIGATAGTSFAPATGPRTIAWSQGTKVLQPGKYYVVMTTNCASSCATITADNSTLGVTFQNGATAGTTTGGTLISFTPPADVWSWGASVPALVVK